MCGAALDLDCVKLRNFHEKKFGLVSIIDGLLLACCVDEIEEFFILIY